MPDPEVSNKEDARLWIGSPGFEDQPPCGKNTYAPEVTESKTVKSIHFIPVITILKQHNNQYLTLLFICKKKTLKVVSKNLLVIQYENKKTFLW